MGGSPRARICTPPVGGKRHPWQPTPVRKTIHGFARGTYTCTCRPAPRFTVSTSLAQGKGAGGNAPCNPMKAATPAWGCRGRSPYDVETRRCGYNKLFVRRGAHMHVHLRARPWMAVRTGVGRHGWRYPRPAEGTCICVPLRPSEAMHLRLLRPSEAMQLRLFQTTPNR